MENSLVIAAWLCVALGLVHSALGEFLIFRHLRNPGALIPTRVAPPLKERHIRILWASWHVVSILGWTIAIVLYLLSVSESSGQTKVLDACALGTFLSSLLVLDATKGKHPGWIALTVITYLIFINT